MLVIIFFVLLTILISNLTLIIYLHDFVLQNFLVLSHKKSIQLILLEDKCYLGNILFYYLLFVLSLIIACINYKVRLAVNIPRCQ